jgi:uncharacterized protein
VLRTDAAVTVLVNNAGIAVNDDMADADPDRLEAMIRLNVLAPSRLARPRFPDSSRAGAELSSTSARSRHSRRSN